MQEELLERARSQRKFRDLNTPRYTHEEEDVLKQIISYMLNGFVIIFAPKRA